MALYYVVGMMKVTAFLILWIISGASNHTSREQILKDYNIVILSSLNIVERTYFIKLYEDFEAKSLDMSIYNTQRKLNLRVEHCNRV
jgi:hypothetical protein